MFLNFFKKEPIGIGGLMLIPIVTIISTMIFTANNLFTTWKSYDERIAFELYSVHKFLTLSVIICLLLQLLSVIFGFIILYLIMRRDIRTRNSLVAFFMIKTMTINFSYLTLREISYHFVIDDSKINGNSLMHHAGTLLLIPYLLLSRRVKNTFTRNYKIGDVAKNAD